MKLCNVEFPSPLGVIFSLMEKQGYTIKVGSLGVSVSSRSYILSYYILYKFHLLQN